MKYLVLSDIHGDRNYLNRVLAQVPDIKNIIFLGDGLSEMLDVKRQNPEYNIILKKLRWQMWKSVLQNALNKVRCVE